MSTRIAALPGIAFVPLAFAATAAMAADAPQVTWQVEYHPIVAGASSKRSNGDPKAFLPTGESLPTEVALHVHHAADGTATHDCVEHPAEQTSPAPTVQPEEQP